MHMYSFSWLLCCLSGAHGSSNLLNSYLPASMQALAYYIDQLQYEPQSATTVEPPFRVNDTDAIASSSTTTSTRPPNNGEPISDWRPPTWWGALTTSTKQPTTIETTTRRPTNWWRPSSTTTTLPPTSKPTSWWTYSSTTQQLPALNSTTTTRKPSSWWSYPTPAPINRQPAATLPHRPGIYAPAKTPGIKRRPQLPEGYELFNEIGDNPEGFDQLTLSLIRDILAETDHDAFSNDFDSLDNFLRLYDDNYGRAAYDPDSAMDRWSSASTAGKKRIPPTKPYVEFLLVYDLLKRDAKAANLSKYEGFAPEIMQELVELSHISAERQLYTMFKRMLDRNDIQRSDVVTRIQSIMKDLGNPESVTAKSLRTIPALAFTL